MGIHSVKIGRRIRRAVYVTIWGGIVILPGPGHQAAGQLTRPRTLSDAPGVHLYSYDGRSHRSTEYYTALRKIVQGEFQVQPDSSAIDVVFIDEELREELNNANPDRFEAADWSGAFISPCLILILGERESDDTFIHEYLHFLQTRGLIFQHSPQSILHQLITQDEGLILGSKSYLLFLKKRPRP
jgi:hypothetical protein